MHEGQSRIKKFFSMHSGALNCICTIYLHITSDFVIKYDESF